MKKIIFAPQWGRGMQEKFFAKKVKKFGENFELYKKTQQSMQSSLLMNKKLHRS